MKLLFFEITVHLRFWMYICWSCYWKQYLLDRLIPLRASKNIRSKVQFWNLMYAVITVICIWCRGKFWSFVGSSNALFWERTGWWKPYRYQLAFKVVQVLWVSRYEFSSRWLGGTISWRNSVFEFARKHFRISRVQLTSTLSYLQELIYLSSKFCLNTISNC